MLLIDLCCREKTEVVFASHSEGSILGTMSSFTT